MVPQAGALQRWRRGSRRDYKGRVNHAVGLGLYLKHTGCCYRVSAGESPNETYAPEQSGR